MGFGVHLFSQQPGLPVPHSASPPPGKAGLPQLWIYGTHLFTWPQPPSPRAVNLGERDVNDMARCSPAVNETGWLWQSQRPPAQGQLISGTAPAPMFCM